MSIQISYCRFLPCWFLFLSVAVLESLIYDILRLPHRYNFSLYEMRPDPQGIIDLWTSCSLAQETSGYASRFSIVGRLWKSNETKAVYIFDMFFSVALAGCLFWNHTGRCLVLIWRPYLFWHLAVYLFGNQASPIMVVPHHANERRQLQTIMNY